MRVSFERRPLPPSRYAYRVRRQFLTMVYRHGLSRCRSDREIHRVTISPRPLQGGHG